MAEFLLMPQATPTMTVGVLAKWTVPEGGELKPQSVIAAVETDKATMDIEFFDKGVLLRQLAKEGDEIPPGRPIAIIGKPGEDVTALLAEFAALGVGLAAPAATPEAPPAAVPAATLAPVAPAPAAPALAAAPAAPSAPHSPGKTPELSWAGKPVPDAIMEPRGRYVPASDKPRVVASPLAKAVAADLGVRLDHIAGTGPSGRITRDDVTRAAKTPTAAPKAARADVVKRATQMRKTIARRLTEAHQTVPVFFLTVTFDMTAFVGLKAAATAAGIKVSYNDLLLRAIGRALIEHPNVNAAWTPEGIVERGSVDIGVAVALPEGLVTPIVRNADTKSASAIATEVRELAARAKEGKLQPDEYTGGSFTVSNLGMLDVEHFTAIINPPEAAILAVGAVAQVPVVVNGQVSVGWRMSLTMTCDHRVIDGANGAKFLQTLRRYVEAPALMVL